MNHRIDQLVMKDLQDVEDDYLLKRKQAICPGEQGRKKLRNIPPSKFQKDILNSHPGRLRILVYQINDLGEGRFSVLRMGRPIEETHFINPNPLILCRRDARCLVRCKRCGLNGQCWHMLTCTCQMFAYRNQCQHLHFIHQMLNEGNLLF